MSRRAAPKAHNTAARSEEGSPVNAAPNRFQQAKAPSGSSGDTQYAAWGLLA